MTLMSSYSTARSPICSGDTRSPMVARVAAQKVMRLASSCHITCTRLRAAEKQVERSLCACATYTHSAEVRAPKACAGHRMKSGALPQSRCASPPWWLRHRNRCLRHRQKQLIEFEWKPAGMCVTHYCRLFALPALGRHPPQCS